jgi:hypothetical protein
VYHAGVLERMDRGDRGFTVRRPFPLTVFFLGGLGCSTVVSKMQAFSAWEENRALRVSSHAILCDNTKDANNA